MHQNEIAIIRFPTLQKKLDGISRSTVDRWEKDKAFPKRITLGKNSVGWNLSSVEQWIMERSGSAEQEDK